MSLHSMENCGRYVTNVIPSTEGIIRVPRVYNPLPKKYNVNNGRGILELCGREHHNFLRTVCKGGFLTNIDVEWNIVATRVASRSRCFPNVFEVRPRVLDLNCKHGYNDIGPIPRFAAYQTDSFFLPHLQWSPPEFAVQRFSSTRMKDSTTGRETLAARTSLLVGTLV